MWLKMLKKLYYLFNTLNMNIVQMIKKTFNEDIIQCYVNKQTNKEKKMVPNNKTLNPELTCTIVWLKLVNFTSCTKA